MEFFNSLNLTQIKGGTKLKQGDLGSVLSYSLTDENGQEITSFDTKTAYINLVLDDKIWFTTTTLVDISRVTFRIDKAIPIGLYYLEIKIDDYIFPSDRDSIILIEEGSTPYDLKELVPNYDINMTLKGILSDLSQKGVDITDLNRRIGNVNAQLAEKANKDEVTNVMTPKGNIAYASLPTTGNQVGWYYYCPDGDGIHGAGNYVWNGTSWYFGGTGDEGYNLLKKDLANKGNSIPFKSGKYIDTNGILNSGNENDLYTDFIAAKKGNKLVSNIGGGTDSNFISIYSSTREDSYIDGVTNTWNSKEKTYTFELDCYFRLYANANVASSNNFYAYLFSNNELLIEAKAKKNIESIIEYSSDAVIKKFIKQALLTGEKQHIKITAIGNATVYNGNTEYFVNAEDDNGNSYNYYVNNVDKPKNYIKLSNKSTTLELYVDWSVIPKGVKQHYLDAYISDKAYDNTAFDYASKENIDAIKEDISTIKVKYLKGLKKDLTLVEKISLGESDIYYKNITDVSVINYVKTISGINAQSVTFYPQDEPLDGKKLAVRLTLSDGTIKYGVVTENKKYTYDGLTISEICIYVDSNYLTSPCIVSGQICIDTDKKPLIKRIEQNENNIKQLEVDSDNDYIELNNNCKQNTLGIPTFNTGKWIDSNGVLNNGSSDDGYTDYFRVYKGQTVYIYGNSWASANLISFYDDNKNYVNGEAGTGKAIESSFEVEHDGYVRLCIHTNIIPISNVYSFVMNPVDNYIIDKLRPIQDDWISSKFDEITTKYRFIALTFQDYYQALNLIGSNDFFDSAYKIKQNVFVPKLGRKTLRDPSWMYYKGYFYIVYTVEATKEDSLITDTDFDEIGVVRTKDFITFYEYPHIHLSDSEHKFITHIWAPAFCVLDNKPYILTWARTSDDYGSFLFEYNPKTNEAKFIKKMNNMNLDTHIYKVNDSYYSVGNGDNEKGIKIMKSPTLTGDYTKIAELATSAYFEGAYLIPKDDGTWRILMKGENGYYWSDSSTSELDSTWTNPVAVKKDFTWVEQHLTVIDMLNVDFNQFT